MATAFVMAAAVGVGAVLLQCVLRQLPHDVGDTIGTAVTALVSAALSVVVFRRRARWVEPVARLTELLPKVRAGERAIDELSTVGGGLAPIVPALRDLLHDLRAQRAAMAELNDELRQRVAGRTNVLERRLGALYRQATLDTLTGLRNRRLMDQALPRLIDHARAARTEVGVIMFDVDHFKALNDSRGHAAGDDFLRNLGQLIKSGVHGERDLAFRVGGDEFVIVCADATADACKSLTDRLVRLSEALGETYRMPVPPRLSAGWAMLSEAPGADAQALVALADKRLYEVKASQRRMARAS